MIVKTTTGKTITKAIFQFISSIYHNSNSTGKYHKPSAKIRYHVHENMAKITLTLCSSGAPPLLSKYSLLHQIVIYDVSRTTRWSQCSSIQKVLKWSITMQDRALLSNQHVQNPFPGGLTRCLNHLKWVFCSWRRSLPDAWAPHTICKAEPCPHCEGNAFWSLVSATSLGNTQTSWP